jgi:hypothetical protein
MNWKRPSRKELALSVREEVADEAEDESERDVGGIGECRGNLAHQHVARDAAAQSAEQGHQDDADDRELLVVIGPSREQRAVQRVRRGSDQIHGGEASVPREATPVHRARE